ncbi:hypothetical protein AWB68_01776 [Caballeronia choica]|jgi:hypothetical protein|uniref:Uncharacterized protein n=1 Tax=Caballeronia choica TaxID=326476 RepID=A0A158H996_9BURK|nr:hypothetical protein [Caballeronia choica]SAL40717.1 hypothetical protein AWB68_01776 [Caballeronia choica]
MYHSSEVFPSVATTLSAHPMRIPRKRRIETVVTLTVTVPGSSSSGPRRQLLDALGERVRVYVAATDRRHDCITLRVEVPNASLDAVIGALTANLAQATLGRATTTAVRR